MQLVVASNNARKVYEIKSILSHLHLSIKSLMDLSLELSPLETGSTFSENAQQKAAFVSNYIEGFVIADDSGLEVDALHGEPGIFSARYAGPKATDSKNNQKLLAALSGVPWEKRSARFHCVIALVAPSKEVYLSEGTCEGFITHRPLGKGGFGYDPIFYLPEYKLTMGQLSPEIKNRISHRAIALDKTREILEGLLPFHLRVTKIEHN